MRGEASACDNRRKQAGAVDGFLLCSETKPLAGSLPSTLFAIGPVWGFFDFLGPLSFEPFGRPTFLSCVGLVLSLVVSKCCVSRLQVRPFQMSRIAFSLTPNERAIMAAGCCLSALAEAFSILILKMSTACCSVKKALNFLGTACFFSSIWPSIIATDPT